ncbi:MAG: DUF2971 domain-containing protein [Bacteroidota bacterium]
MPLYHYTSLDTFLKYIMPSKTLRTNSLAQMNDPRESHEWAFGSINLPLEELFPGYYSEKTHIDCQFKFGQMVKDRFQVICFSGANKKGWDNEMMWAHYGDRHKGVCLEFDEGKLLAAVNYASPDIKYQVRNVNYEQKRKKKPWINWDRKISHEENFTNFLEVLSDDTVFSKSHFWELEDEKRIIFFNERDYLFIPFDSALTAVHIGLGIPKSQHDEIFNVVSGFGIKLYVMIYDNNNYKRWSLTKKDHQWWTTDE